MKDVIVEFLSQPSICSHIDANQLVGIQPLSSGSVLMLCMAKRNCGKSLIGVHLDEIRYSIPDSDNCS